MPPPLPPFSQEYESGRMLTGYLKKELISVVQALADEWAPGEEEDHHQRDGLHFHDPETFDL